MKKTKILLLLFVMTAATIIKANAQKIGEGKVTFDITYPDADIPEEQMAMMPTEMTNFFKGGQSRVEMKMGMGMSQVMLFDNKNKIMTMLLDMMGNKTAVKMTADDIKKQREKEGNKDIQVKETNETKEIAGYKCKKAIITSDEGTFDMYYTDQITFKNGDWVSEYKGVKGFPLQYKMTMNNTKMQITAKNVSNEKPEDSMFTVPSDYKYMTQEELQKMYGGGK